MRSEWVREVVPVRKPSNADKRNPEIERYRLVYAGESSAWWGPVAASTRINTNLCIRVSVNRCRAFTPSAVGPRQIYKYLLYIVLIYILLQYGSIQANLPRYLSVTESFFRWIGSP